MTQCLALIAGLRKSKQPDLDGSLNAQQQEAEQFLRELAEPA